MFDLNIDLIDAGARLLLAMALGALIGWDRESRRVPAGLRTHILVSLGAAILAVIASALGGDGESAPEYVRIDPTRVIAAIVGGIGFLGAGAIIRQGERVQGITTAAGMWVTAALGIAAGLGLYGLAVLGGALTFLTLVALLRLEHAMPSSRKSPDKDG